MLAFVYPDYTLTIVILGTTILGITAGALGVFAFLRQQSLLGDAISHAALPGIACAFLFTHSTSPAVLLFGGAIAGGIGTLFVYLITHKTTLKNDAALGIVLSVFFGLGLILLTMIQKQPIANQAILNKFLFGNAATLLLDDVYVMACVSVGVLSCLVLLWPAFKVLTFDPAYARVLGYPVALLDLVLTSLLVLSIVIGLQTVGVVLMSTMFIAPAAAARQWCSRLGSLVILAACFGACAGIVGSLISSRFDQLPTGPTIVVVISSMVLFSLLCAPHRGLLWRKQMSSV